MQDVILNTTPLPHLLTLLILLPLVGVAMMAFVKEETAVKHIAGRVPVVSGVAEVTAERCTVLADEAALPDTLDRAAIEADLRIVEGNLPSLREQVARAGDTDRERLLIELHRLERDQAVLLAKLQALGEIGR